MSDSKDFIVAKRAMYLEQLEEVGKCVCEHYGNCKSNYCLFSDIDKYNCFANQVATKVMNKGFRQIEKEVQNGRSY